MPDRGKYSSEEARRILERAARIQAEDDDDEVSTGDLAAAAEQAGISRGALMRALGEARGLEAKPTREQRRTGSAVEASLHLDTPVSDAAVDRVWDLAMREHGGGGVFEVRGNTRVWRSALGGDRVEIGVVRGASSTDVWIRQKDRLHLIGYAFFFGALIGVFARPLPLLILASGFGGLVGLLVWRARRKKLLRELDRLLDQIEAELLHADRHP